MSCLTGDGSDLYTHVSMEKMYDMKSYKTSDLMECFEIFKKKTNGTIYQFRKVDVTEDNLEEIKNKNKFFDYRIEEVKSTTKSGKEKIKSTYIFTYYTKEYVGFKEINKKGVYVKCPIYFETILDLMPYLPYGICSAACDQESEHIIIGNESLIDKYEKYSSPFNKLCGIYRKALSDLYFDVCKKYLCYKLDERTQIEPIRNIRKLEDGDYEVTVNFKVDYNHPIEYVFKDGVAKSHWGSPKYFEEDKIILYREDVESFLREDIRDNNLQIKYVSYPAGGFIKYLD